MIIKVVLNSIGSNTGPLYNLYTDADAYAVPFATNVVPSSLLAPGQIYTVLDGTTQIKIVNVGGVCGDYTMTVLLLTTTTTTIP